MDLETVIGRKKADWPIIKKRVYPTGNLVSCPRNNIYFAGSQLAVFSTRERAPIPHHFHATLETKSTRNIEIGAGCSAPRALSTAHFDRNKIYAISGTGH